MAAGFRCLVTVGRALWHAGQEAASASDRWTLFASHLFHRPVPAMVAIAFACAIWMKGGHDELWETASGYIGGAPGL